MVRTSPCGDSSRAFRALGWDVRPAPRGKAGAPALARELPDLDPRGQPADWLEVGCHAGSFDPIPGIWPEDDPSAISPAEG
jgi:hypothetical protein